MDDLDDLDTASLLFQRPPVVQNVSSLALYAHKKVNRQSKRDYVEPNRFKTTFQEVVLVGGGSSINGQLHEIHDLFTNRIPIVTVNGAYKWCIEQYMLPQIQIMVDARVENARFNEPQLPGTDYWISDECHPDILKVLPRWTTYLWDRNKLDGGSTVMLCAIPLLKFAGVKKIHVFGFDSCILDKHHGYPQAENDADTVMRFNLEGRLFSATPWMISQAEEFLEKQKDWGMNLKVYGDGLIAWMLNSS